MNRMAGDGDLGADIVMTRFVIAMTRFVILLTRFVIPGHSPRTRMLLAGSLLVAAAGAGGCAGELSTLSPAGPAAARIAEIWWAMFAGAALILIGVMALALYSLRPRRKGAPSHRLMLVGGGLVFPSVTMGALMIFAFLRGEDLIARDDPDALTVSAHATQWSWRFFYPDGERTQDILHVRAGETFYVRVTSGDVIHSFWAPRLGGKIDAIPGKENVIALRADSPGVYAGVCAEFCGVGHTQMIMEVRAHAHEDFAAALAAAQPGLNDERQAFEPRPPPAAERIDAAIARILQWMRGE